MLRRFVLIVLLVLLVAVAPAQAAVVVLVPTGDYANGVPVLQPHPDGAQIAGVLAQGFGGRVLRLYAWTQTYVTGAGPQPAYLLLKPGSGGFPKVGFYLGQQDFRHVPYVEVATGPTTGRFGSVASTFSHEMAHVMMKLLGARPQSMRSTQVHSIGVRTDSSTAFHEGFAESFEVMFVDDPEADAATRALVSDPGPWQQARDRLNGYRRDLGSWAAPLARWRFRQWHPRTEDVLRYAAVKENLFARQPSVAGLGLNEAYLVGNILPGSPADPPKSAARMLQSEGVLSALFYRWANSPVLQGRYLDDGFYARFGAARFEVGPVENVYLKLFHAMYVHKPSTAAELVTGYKAAFPEEAAEVDRLVAEALLGQPLPTAPEIWLANRDFLVGVMVYDQFRQLAHVHTFDLNAASLTDLLGVPGVDRPLAERILAQGPYAGLADLGRVDGVSPRVLQRFETMSEDAGHLGSALLVSYGLHVLWFLTVAGAAAGLVYRQIRPVGWGRALVNGVGAALPSLVPFWFFGYWMQALPLLVPVLLFGLPAALWAWWRGADSHGGDWGGGVRKLLAWLAAPVPAFLWLVM